MVAQRFGALSLSCASVLALSSAPSDALACGGCFHEPPEIAMATTSVAAHRMALVVGAEETVLWDQIVYTGDPRDFVWVLPVDGEPAIELSDNAFFEALSDVTAITLTGPPLVCPVGDAMVPMRPGGTAVSRGPLAGLSDPDASVSVLFQGTVGPYATAIVRSTSSSDLVDWLLERHYRVPEDTVPLIASYADRGMSFVVLRLAGQAGVDRIQPVRIRMPGVSTTLPLRMIGAGAGLLTDLELFVLAEARMEVVGPNAEVDRSAIAWDWATGSFDYDSWFDEALFSGATTDPTAWVTEGAFFLPVERVRDYASIGPAGETHTAREDLDVVLAGTSTPYLTRLRTRLPRAELDHDLVLQLSDRGDVGTEIRVERELHRDATCAALVGTGADAVVVAPPPRRAPARGSSGPRCLLHVGRPSSPGPALVVAALGLVLALRRRP